MDRSKASTHGLSAQDTGSDSTTDGLRSRKKARRREEILEHARTLFGERGVDATTMAEIAEAAGVSTPTVFNYFGNKDGILIAIIAEGAQNARENSKVLEPRTDVPFLTTLMTVFMDVSVETMAIASKRIWRYANAAAMRHPTTDLATSFRNVDDALLDIIEIILAPYELTLKDGSHGDPRVIANLFFDVWMQMFNRFLTRAEMSIETHRDELEHRFAPLCGMIFAPAFLETPGLRTPAPNGKRS
ncbi:TetR/AcrR family transcriptional regulator [Tropicibacter sp. S64]|uniref:TetR/AcrR family transcriptional regulator n=1 Tax=Tropicibacter sp. S64 TaxID=3415122 RepID=UPI003C7DAB0F